jgi:GumN protein.
MFGTPRSLAIGALALALLTGSAKAQERPEVTVEDVVVVARRSGAPIWEVRNGLGTLVLVGSIQAVPREAPWSPDALEDAVRAADQVILSQSATMSLGDFFRMRRARAKLPAGSTSADYLDASWHDRLMALARQYRQDYDARGLVASARDLLDRRLRFEQGRGLSAQEVVRRAARKARRPVRLVGDLDASHVDDSIATPDATQIACLQASIAATEAGPAGLIERGRAWTSQRVVDVVASPAERAWDRCAWFADTRLRVAGRAQWADAALEALNHPGVTMLVAPITVIAEAQGLLDQIEAEGLEIIGPEWKVRD